jgi:hypothetical protein
MKKNVPHCGAKMAGQTIALSKSGQSAYQNRTIDGCKLK